MSEELSSKQFRRTVLVPAVLSLVAALLGAVIGGGITWWTASRSLQSQERQFEKALQEERERDVRPIKQEVYTELVAAVDDLWADNIWLLLCGAGDDVIFDAKAENPSPRVTSP